MFKYKQVYDVDEQGLIKEIYAVEFDGEGNPVDDLPESYVLFDPPRGLWRPKWTGEEWVEDMSQEEIDEIRNQPVPLSDTEVLGQQMTEREIEAIEQGQQITDLELESMIQGQQLTDIEIRLLEMEATRNV